MHEELISVIRQVRRRWRMKLALRGAVGVLGLGLLVLLAGAFGLEAARFDAGAIVAFRILAIVAFLGLAALLLVRPLLRQVSDEQVALYLEEHEPSLQAEIVSAVEAGRSGAAAESVLVGRLVASAIEKCRTIDDGRRLERRPMRRYAAGVAAVALAALAIFALGPGYLRHALSALVTVSRSVEAAVPYRIEVTPGNATVPRGVDQAVAAALSGFDADRASLMVRKSPDAAFERLPLVRGDDGRFEGMLFDLAGSVDYFVEASGVRSPVFSLKVVELPYVETLELEFHFPAYTGLAPQKVEDGGDIAVLRGTEVRVKVVPTMASRGGQVVLDEMTPAPLAAAADGALTTRFTVEKDGFYHVELDAPNGERVAGSPKYSIDVLTDMAPTVSVAKPGRDTTASPIEEVFIEARAEDDFGVRDLDLVYSVNGGPAKTVRLFDGRARLQEVTAGHTFYLEEFNVEPGDFVSYYAQAADNDAVGGRKQTTSDIYFLRIRPLSKEFRRAQSDAGAGGGGGGGEVGALSDQQRRIIAATFNVQRDRKKLTADKLRENSVVVGLSQSRLREQVEGLLTRMNSRLVEQDPRFKKVAELLPQATAAMKDAEAKLQAVNPDAALAPEQKALQFLQKAEEEYELQVQMGRQQGGGGSGGGQSSMAQDLADLFEMELDKMANQYETRQQVSQQQADQQVDELAEKLKELARRQEQEAERQRRRAALGQQQSGGGAGDQQRALADQVEEAARRLEQLSREQNRSDLQQAARQLRQSADAMRRAAAGGQQASGAQAADALEKLREAQRQLQQSQSGRAERDVQEALRRAQELAGDQRQISEDTKGIDPGGDRRQQQVQQLAERKRELESRVGEFEKQLDRTAAEIRRDERQAARKVEEAANTIRENRMREKVRYSARVLEQGSQEGQAEAQRLDGEVAEHLRALTDKLSQAASALGRSASGSDTLERARNLARGMESLEQRMRERAEQRAQGQNAPGQTTSGRAQQNEQNQQGQEGPEGQQGQRGQQGEQGQAREGQPGGQGGRNEGGRTNEGGGGEGDTVGPWREDMGGAGSRRPGRYTSDDIRQFRNEVRQWTNEAQQLRRLVQGQKIDPRELDDILKGLRALDDDRVYHNASELQRLQTFVTEGLKRFEYNLRRKSELKGNEVFLSGSDTVPEEFRKKVEEYYKSLAIKK